MTALETRKKIQELLHMEVIDGVIGPKSLKAFRDLSQTPDDAQWPEGIVVAPPLENNNPAHQVMASSFADPADVRAYKAAKARGLSDQDAFKLGDNGIGKWGDDTTVDIPMCALPPEDWEHLSRPRGAKVLVKSNGRSVVCELRDTMPRKKNIKNGAGIDLNPAAWKALGKKPPVMLSATWQWV